MHYLNKSERKPALPNNIQQFAEKQKNLQKIFTHNLTIHNVLKQSLLLAQNRLFTVRKK